MISFDEDDLLSMLESLIESADRCTCFAPCRDREGTGGHSPSCRRVRVRDLCVKIQMIARAARPEGRDHGLW